MWSRPQDRSEPHMRVEEVHWSGSCHFFADTHELRYPPRVEGTRRNDAFAVDHKSCRNPSRTSRVDGPDPLVSEEPEMPYAIARVRQTGLRACSTQRQGRRERLGDREPDQGCDRIPRWPVQNLHSPGSSSPTSGSRMLWQDFPPARMEGSLR